MTFVADNDIWLGPVGGGRAWRLSADRAPASRPRLSPDGSQVAWTSRKDGPPEVYLAGTAGGPSQRLTHWGHPQTQVCGWTPAGEVLAVSSTDQPFAWLTWAYAIQPNPQQPDPRRLAFGPVTDLALTSAGVALLTGSLPEPAWWKRYRGGTAGRLWLRPVEDEPFRQLAADLDGHFACPMLVAGRLAFLSDHEGTGNVYSVAPDGSDLRRHTDHDGGYARQAGTDGSRIVYSCRGDLWLLDGLDAAEPQLLDISLGAAQAGRMPRLISAADHVGSLSCDETGQASAVEVRGTVHWLTHRDGPARALAVTPGVRTRLPQVLGKDGLAVWVTDAEGPDALQVGGERNGDPVPARLLASGAIGWVTELAAAPDGSAVAVAARDGHLRVVDVASGAVTDLARSEDGQLSGLAWSADSAWLAWSQPGPRPLRRIRLAGVADRQVHDVTDGRFVDTDPGFTADGRYLAFLSQRSFDPVYDAHFFDLSFPYGARPYLVPLAADTPSPSARCRVAGRSPTRRLPGPAAAGTTLTATTIRTATRLPPPWPWTSTESPPGWSRCPRQNRDTRHCVPSRAAWPGSGCR